MTLILACLTADRIVVAADRRLTLPNGSLYDDDTNKAVFYCGRCAIAYTGPAKIQGQDTSTWIGGQLVGEDSLEPALEKIARELERIFGPKPTQGRRIAILAFGWAKQYGQPPPRPFCAIVSNFFDRNQGWLSRPNPVVSVEVEFLDRQTRNRVIVAGQGLHPTDALWLTRRTRSCAEHNTGPSAYAFFLGETIRAVAAAGDARSKRVGRALIIQSLSLAAIQRGDGGLLSTPLTADANSFLYVAKDGSVDRFQGPILVCGRSMLTDVGGGTIRPGEKSIFES